LPAALFAARPPGAWPVVQPPPRRALPGDTRYGTIRPGIGDDNLPRASGME
jgi:hypothetical protein